MNNNPADLQKSWHDYFGNLVNNSTILDVGSGQGSSKERLEVGNNIVTTSDINRAFMNNVDFITDTRDLECLSGTWDYVTAFDVIEHVCFSPVRFLMNLRAVCTKAFFVTTPNGLIHTNPWHYVPEQFVDMIINCEGRRWFARHKGFDFDKVEEVKVEELLRGECYAMGALVLR